MGAGLYEPRIEREKDTVVAAETRAPVEEPGFLRRFVICIWKVFLGAVFCQFAVTSLLTIGWTYRLMQRTAFKRWWMRSPDPARSESFASFAHRSSVAPDHARYPNWIVGRWPKFKAAYAPEVKSVKSLVGAFSYLFVGGLWQNAKFGVQGLLTVWSLTLLPTMLWQIGWYSGWDNSFNHGYEQHAVGMILSWIGIGLFLLAMLYVPMAMARHAVTGEWRRFYDFKVVWRFVQQRRVACLIVAGVFSLVSLPLTIMKSFPAMFLEEAELNSMSDAELLQYLNSFYFWACVFGFLGFVAVRLVVVRVYAGAVVDAYQKGLVEDAELGRVERTALTELGYIRPSESSDPHLLIRLMGTATKPFWRASLTVATILAWFTFVAQIYVSEFLNYHPVRGFANQPLIQAPWFKYVPKHLENPDDAAP